MTHKKTLLLDKIAGQVVALAVGENLYVYGTVEATARVQEMLRRLAIAESQIYADVSKQP